MNTDYTFYQTSTGEIVADGCAQQSVLPLLAQSRPGCTLYIGQRLKPAEWVFVNGQPERKL